MAEVEPSPASRTSVGAFGMPDDREQLETIWDITLDHYHGGETFPLPSGVEKNVGNARLWS